MAYWLRPLVVLIENPGSILSSTELSVTTAPGVLHLLGSLSTGHQASSWCTDIDADRLPIHVKYRLKK